MNCINLTLYAGAHDIKLNDEPHRATKELPCKYNESVFIPPNRKGHLSGFSLFKVTPKFQFNGKQMK